MLVPSLSWQMFGFKVYGKKGVFSHRTWIVDRPELRNWKARGVGCVQAVAEGQKRRCKKTPPSPQHFLYLSRACLGKTILSSIKWRKNAALSLTARCGRVLLAGMAVVELHCRREAAIPYYQVRTQDASFRSQRFLAFVPSLSWQNDPS